MLSYQYSKSYCEDKTIQRPSYLHNGISYTGKPTSLHWNRAQNTARWHGRWSLLVLLAPREENSLHSVPEMQISWRSYHITVMLTMKWNSLERYNLHRHIYVCQCHQFVKIIWVKSTEYHIPFLGRNEYMCNALSVWSSIHRVPVIWVEYHVFIYKVKFKLCKCISPYLLNIALIENSNTSVIRMRWRFQSTIGDLQSTQCSGGRLNIKMSSY